MRFSNPVVQILTLCSLLCGCVVAKAPMPSGAGKQPTIASAAVGPETACEYYSRAAAQLGLQKLSLTHSLEQIEALLGDSGERLPSTQRAAAATLVLIGALCTDELTCDPQSAAALTERLSAQKQQLQSAPATLQGRIGDLSLLTSLARPRDYSALTQTTPLQNALGQLLASGAITGYDLRARGVYDDIAPGRFLIYSHSDVLHVQQLVAVLAREGVRGWVHLTPKVSAFAYRDGWGGDGTHVVTLPGGARVIQGREFAVLFQFSSAADRMRFHRVVQTFAKRDSDDEAGLIHGAWWQPFYYSDRMAGDFEAITLFVVTTGAHEATLTVTKERAPAVRASLSALDLPVREDKIWVNPAFFRFLNGDFK